MRLSGFDYSRAGMYFVTMDCYHLECFFGQIVREKMILNDFGHIAFMEWLGLTQRFKSIGLHEFVIMPNHVHAIIEIINNDHDNSKKVEFKRGEIKRIKYSNSNPEHHSPSLMEIICAYKSIVSNKCLKHHQEKFESQPHIPVLGKIWKRSFHDSIIWDHSSYKSITRYIKSNPKKWAGG